MESLTLVADRERETPGVAGTMRFLNFLFKRSVKLQIPTEHLREPVDPFYADFNVEDISLYQLHFNRIVEHVDLVNYTKWSKSDDSHDRARREADDVWMYDYLMRIEKEEGVKGAVLQNMVNQYIFADILVRELRKDHWINQVLHPRPTDDYFPDAARTRMVVGLVSE